MPATSRTRTILSVPAHASSEPGECSVALTTPTPVCISAISFCVEKFHTRQAPSTTPAVQTILFAPSQHTAATGPTCAGARGVTLEFFPLPPPPSIPYDLSAMFQIEFAPPRRFSCRRGSNGFFPFFPFFPSPSSSSSSSSRSLSASERLYAPLCAPLCKLNLCTSPPSVPTTAKFFGPFHTKRRRGGVQR
eukprot:31054-Pelagococcus_subviridis.AAC.1